MITPELLSEFENVLAKLKKAAERPERVTQTQRPEYQSAGYALTCNTIEVVVRPERQ
jgi:hypothetical protein